MNRMGDYLPVFPLHTYEVRSKLCRQIDLAECQPSACFPILKSYKESAMSQLDEFTIPARVCAAIEALKYVQPAAFCADDEAGVPPGLTKDQRAMELDAIRVVREYINRP